MYPDSVGGAGEAVCKPAHSERQGTRLYRRTKIAQGSWITRTSRALATRWVAGPGHTPIRWGTGRPILRRIGPPNKGCMAPNSALVPSGAIFYAEGRIIRKGARLKPFENVNVYPFRRRFWMDGPDRRSAPCWSMRLLRPLTIENAALMMKSALTYLRLGCGGTAHARPCR